MIYPSIISRSRTILEELDAHCRNADYLSWDPFDGLNSRLFNATPLKDWPLARLAWLQLFKRLPFNLRPLAQVPKTANAKTYALLARSYALWGKPQDAAAMCQKLLALRCDTQSWGEAAWGYPFPWQARAFYVPPETPNSVVTAYAVRALTNPAYDAFIQASAAFVEKQLLRSRGGEAFIAYVPGSDALVHNASLWGAYVLSEAYARGGLKQYSALAEDVIHTTLRQQREDGSWIYGERHHHGWVDSYHTGYVLEALSLCGERLGTKAYLPAIARGMAFYTHAFFSREGLPRLYPNRDYPLDTQAAAQVLITLTQVLPTPERLALAERTLAWTLDHVWLPEKKHFLYKQYSCHLSNRIDYLRWTQAWMHLGISQWLNPTP